MLPMELQRLDSYRGRKIRPCGDRVIKDLAGEWMLKKCASALELLKRNSAPVVYLTIKLFPISAHFLPGNQLSKPRMSRFSRFQVRAESVKTEEF